MKNWLWTLLAIAGGYAAYRHWFADGEAPVPHETPLALEAPAAPVEAEEPPLSRPPVLSSM